MGNFKGQNELGIAEILQKTKSVFKEWALLFNDHDYFYTANQGRALLVPRVMELYSASLKKMFLEKSKRTLERQNKSPR